MVMRTTRAVDGSGHARVSATSWAVHGSSHSSGSDSLESGRERRRRGKLRMQQRIDFLDAQLTTANSRISDLEAQNLCLKDLADELTRRTVANTGHAPPVLFDVYAEDVTSVACQTDISVKHNQVDQFCMVDDAGNYVPVRREQQSATAHADAAAGSGPARWQALEGTSEHRVACSNDFNSQDLAPLAGPCAFDNEQCGHMPHQSTRQALDDTNSKHRVASSKDFNSQDLALSAEPFAFEATEQCTTHVCSNNNSQDLANFSEPLADFGQTQCRHLPQSTRRALEDTNTKHRVASSKGFNSQDLALSAEPFAFEATEQCTTHVCKSNISQDLANTSEPLADYGQTQCGHLPQSTRQALEDTNSKHRVASFKDFNSQDLAPSAGPFAFEQCTTHVCKSYHSQDLANTSEPLADFGQTQCGHLPRSTRQALEDTNSKHRVASSKDFSSQDLALSAEPFAFEANEQCTTHVCMSNISQDLANTSEPLADYGQTQCGHLPQSTRQALDDTHSKHRVARSEDFNSQDLAPPAGPLSNLGAARNHTNVKSRCRKEPHRCQISVPQGTTQMSNLGAARNHTDVKSRCCKEPQVTPEHKEQCTTQMFGSTNFQDLATTHEPLEHLVQTQCGHLPQNTRQALDDTHSKHRVAGSIDFNSQDLAPSAGPVAFEANEQCKTQVLSYNSQDLATTSEPLADFGQTQCGHLPQVQDARRALGDTNTKHRGTCSKDFVSQDLAPSTGPFAFESDKQCTTQDVGSANSQNLATNHEHFGNSIPAQCGHLPQHGTRQALEDPHSKHRVACSKDFNSLDLAHSSEPFALGHSEQCTTHMCGGHNSQDLATIHEPLGEFVQAQCGLLPRSRDFNSQDLAVASSAVDASANARPKDVGPCAFDDCEQCGPSSEQVSDFERTLDDIIDIFNRRKKVSNDLLRRTAKAIQTVAAKQGIDLSHYRQSIHARSLRLSTSIFND